MSSRRVGPDVAMKPKQTESRHGGEDRYPLVAVSTRPSVSSIRTSELRKRFDGVVVIFLLDDDIPFMSSGKVWQLEILPLRARIKVVRRGLNL
jgi:hypothetical protein